jgi:DNA invertase Pin-like site-specific DNA recombinase
MQIGCARSSTVDQEAGFQAQIKSLKAAGCEKVFAEQVSSTAQREQLEAALDLDQPRSRSDWGSVEQAFIGS